MANELQRTLVNEVTARIRQEILSGQIAPGQRIRLRPLEESLGISHIPIREALRSLEAEGLVENIPQRGAIATPVSVEELAQVYDLRRLLEPAIARRAVPKLTKAKLELAADALRALNSLPGGWASRDFPEAHRRFHWLLLEPGGTRLIERVLSQLWQTAERYVRFSALLGGAGPMAERQHEVLLRAARAGDAARFRSQLIAHLDNTESRVKRVLNAASSEDGEDPTRQALETRARRPAAGKA